MMLTVKQSAAPYGYRSVHDLPTPPSTFRPSPVSAPSLQESAHKSVAILSRSSSPAMSTPLRGLPPPAAMAATPHAPHHGHGPPSGHVQQGQPWSALPPPPQQWQGAEESMRNWLVAKSEEEKTRQEEERTRQESLRLEQRRIEMDMLRASLSGGIPPSMIPLVFASTAAGGTLPQPSMDWAQHFLQIFQGQQAPQLPPPQRPHSPEHHPREVLHPPPPPLPPPPGPGAGRGAGPASGPGPYAGSSVNHPPPIPTPSAYGPYPASPARPRGQTVTSMVGRHAAGVSGQVTGGPPMAQHQPPPQLQIQPVQREPSPPIFFHHWQPPTSQAGGGSLNRPGTPSGDAHRKRKTVATPQQQQAMPAPTEQRLRSPPAFIRSSLSSPSAGQRSHKRQRSDIAWYRSPGQGPSEEADRTSRARAPSQEADTGSPRDTSGGESKKQSVLALLSQEPTEPTSLEGSRSRFHAAYSQPLSTSGRRDEEEPPRDRRVSPSKGESRLRGGRAAISGDSKR